MFILRGDLGDQTVALCAYLLAKNMPFCLVDIDTGWGSSVWPARRAAIQAWLDSKGISSVTLKSDVDFATLVKERGMPSPKFSWCTLHLKGLPFNAYLDQIDAQAIATVVLPRVAAYLKYPISEHVESCAYHGDRAVWHPLFEHTPVQIQALVATTPIPYLGHRALECAPCIYHRATLAALTDEDKARAAQLEAAHGPIVHPARIEGVQGIVAQCQKATTLEEPLFNTGCGDPFACGN